jgi:hypothetical protein
VEGRNLPRLKPWVNVGFTVQVRGARTISAERLKPETGGRLAPPKAEALRSFGFSVQVLCTRTIMVGLAKAEELVGSYLLPRLKPWVNVGFSVQVPGARAISAERLKPETGGRLAPPKAEALG